MQSQRHLFQLPPDVHYFNESYMSPMLSSVEDAGIQGMIRKRNPIQISAGDFFEEAEIVRRLFGRLVNGRPEQVAIIPSVSYGLASVVSNLPTNTGSTAIVVSDDVLVPGEYHLWNKSALDEKLKKVELYRNDIVADDKKLLSQLNSAE